jgi:hypothetical protein
MARSFLGPMLLGLACCGGCYYRQLLPEMTICLRDQEGQPIVGSSGSWSGYASEDEVHDRPFEFGPDGCARIPRYRMWTTPLHLIAAAIKGLSPHEAGLRSTFTEVTFTFPTGYDVDEAASGLMPHVPKRSFGISWDGPDQMSYHLDWGFLYDPGQGGPEPPGSVFVIRVLDPGRRPALQVRLILKPRPNATAKPRQDARPGGVGRVRGEVESPYSSAAQPLHSAMIQGGRLRPSGPERPDAPVERRGSLPLKAHWQPLGLHDIVLDHAPWSTHPERA